MSLCLFLRGGGRAQGFILPHFLWVECRVEREKSWFYYSVHHGPLLCGFVMQEVSLGPHQQLLWVAESQITQFLRWAFQFLSSCILWRQSKKLLVKKKQICLSYMYVNFYGWDFSSVEFTVFCKVNLYFFNKAMLHLRQKIPIFTLMDFIMCATGLRHQALNACLKTKEK